MSKGHTKLKEIKKAWKEKAIPEKDPLLLECSWENGFKKYSYKMKINENFKISVKKPTKANRVHLHLEGNKSKTRSTVLLHYRNSWKRKPGRRVPACNWVSSPSFQVWIERK